MLKDTSFLAILALGFALAFTVAELDLSIAEVASLAAVVCGWLVHSQYPPGARGRGAALRSGVVLGALNGYGVTVLRIPSLIMTLGTAAIAKGLAFMITQGVAFVGRWPVGFTGLARGYTLRHPQSRALDGRRDAVRLRPGEMDPHRRAYGRDRRGRRGGAARRHRDTARMKRIGLLLAGLLRRRRWRCCSPPTCPRPRPNMAGDYLLYAIAAVLLGMTMFEPGKPNIPGTVFAALVLKVLGNGLVLLGAPYYVQDIVLGAIIIGSVAFSASAMKKAAFKV